MNKRNVMISIDGDLWDDLQRSFPSEMSSKINDFLYRLRAYVKGDLNGLNIAETRKKIEKIDLILAKNEAEKRILANNLDILMKKQAEIERKQAENEKIEAQKQVTCCICGVPKPNDRVHNLPGGIVCNGCYLAEPPQNLQKYLKIDENTSKIDEKTSKNAEKSQKKQDKGAKND